MATYTYDTKPSAGSYTYGTKPTTIRYLGAYSATTAYVDNDEVLYNSVLYVCKLASTGNLPTNTTYWELSTLYYTYDTKPS